MVFQIQNNSMVLVLLFVINTEYPDSYGCFLLFYSVSHFINVYNQ